MPSLVCFVLKAEMKMAQKDRPLSEVVSDLKMKVIDASNDLKVSLAQYSPEAPDSAALPVPEIIAMLTGGVIQKLEPSTLSFGLLQTVGLMVLATPNVDFDVFFRSRPRNALVVAIVWIAFVCFNSISVSM